ncbi:MAG: hypothetical protein MZW92_50050 [Comamonadaceae bacterium]|nr:hypothetical protein [Comamonadaceae bacterium]
MREPLPAAGTNAKCLLIVWVESSIAGRDYRAKMAASLRRRAIRPSCGAMTGWMAP